MNLLEIEHTLKNYLSTNKKIFVSSSFQTHSIPLLHILKSIHPRIDVIFINTGFHFPETIQFRDEVTELLDLNLIDVRSKLPKSQQLDSDGNFHFTSDPDYCCELNKIEPLDPLLWQYDIWISGVRADQSSVRKEMKPEQPGPNKTTRFHPLLDWSAKDVFDYKRKYNLPSHPLDAKAYQSIGCAPCTLPIVLEGDRAARWFGLNKTECGLHKQLA